MPSTMTRLPSGGALHHGPGAPPAAPPLLMLHGVGGAAWSWAPQLQALQGELDCWVWEGRGHGAAARVADAGLADYAQDAREALAAVAAACGRPVALVAHSMGAMLALDLACTRPQAVAGLFLVDPVYAEAGHRPAVLKPLLALLCALVSPLVRSYQRDGALSRRVSRAFFRRAFHDGQAMEQAWALQRRQVPLEFPRMLYESIRGVEGFVFRPWAEHLAAPVLLLEARPRPGARSRFAGTVARLRAHGVACEHTVLDGGHYLQLDRPQEVSALLQAWAQRLSRR